MLSPLLRDKPPYLFSLLHISGCVFWAPPKRITGIANGAPVTTVLDYSGQGNDVTQATAAAKPTLSAAGIGNRPVLSFDAVDDSLLDTSAAGLATQASTLIIVINKATSAGTKSVLQLQQGDGGGTGRRILFFQDDKIRFQETFNTATGSWETNNTMHDAPRILAITYDGGSTANDPVIWSSGSIQAITEIQAPVGTSQYTTIDTIKLGNNGFGSAALGGLIGDIAVYNRILTNAEIARLSRALGRYYGITVA